MADTTTPPSGGDTTSSTPVLTLPQKFEVVPGANRLLYSWVGGFDELSNAYALLKVGHRSEIGEVAGIVASANLERTAGERATLTVVFVQDSHTEYWGIEMAEVQKPIKTWMADDSTDPPNLGQIARWELLKTTDVESYVAYKYDGQTAMTGNTLKLAKMIHEGGIQYYTMHTPIVIRSTLWDAFPDDVGVNLDRKGNPEHRPGWSFAGADISADGNPGTDPITVLTALAPHWIKSVDRVGQNDDGTYSRTEQWIGATAINPDLYPDVETEKK